MTGTRKPGEFCWINMLTPQPEQARDFFGKLLGWSYFEMPGIGHGVQVFKLIVVNRPEEGPHRCGQQHQRQRDQQQCNAHVGLLA